MTEMWLAWWGCLCTVTAFYTGAVGAVSTGASAVTPECGNRVCVHGTCDNNTCICTDGWQGPDCSHCSGKIRFITEYF